MPRYIIKLDDYYMEWSTITDSPVTSGMKLDEFENFYRQMYGESGMAELSERLARVDEKGCSAMLPFETPEKLISGNRAGPNESELTREEIIAAYCRFEKVNGWEPTWID